MWIGSSQIRAAGRIRRPRIPIPTPHLNIPRHVVKTIAIRCKISHRTRIGRHPVGKRRIIAARESEIVGIDGRSVCPLAVVIRMVPINRVAPRKPQTVQSAPRSLLTLCFRRQAIAIGRPIRIDRVGVSGDVNLCQARIRVIYRSQARLLRPRITPLYRVIPIYALHRMIRRLTRTGIVKDISVACGPIIDRLPLAVAHQIRVHIKPRHRHAYGRDGIALTIQRVPHRERTRRNERHAIGGLRRHLTSQHQAETGDQRGQKK